MKDIIEWAKADPDTFRFTLFTILSTITISIGLIAGIFY
jgi:hypothetical protein